MLVLFIFLAFLESFGYMARIAFIMDRIFRKFGLSGKSFIPMPGSYTHLILTMDCAFYLLEKE